MPQNDKRRYVSRNPSSRRDKITSAAQHESGDAALDGFSVRYREPQPERPNPRPVDEPRYRSQGRSDSSRYRENYACEGLMDDDEARMARSSFYYGDY